MRALLIILIIILLNPISFAQEELNAECVPFYKFTKWSTCTNGTQERSAIDLNFCYSDNVQTRNCELNSSELDTLLLNSYEVSFTAIGEHRYQTSLDRAYSESIHSTLFVEGGKFILKDSISGEDYIARVISQDESFYYFQLRPLDEDAINELKQEGFIKSTIGEDIQEVQEDVKQSQGLWVMIIVLLIALIIMMITFIVKKSHSKKDENENSNLTSFSNDIKEKHSIDSSQRLHPYNLRSISIKDYMHFTIKK